MAKANDFLISTNPSRHEVETPVGALVVYVKPLSWLQQQEAISKFVDFVITDGEAAPRIDFGGYWEYILTNCITETEPHLTKTQICNLSPEVGNELAKVLPDLEELTGALGGGEPAPLE